MPRSLSSSLPHCVEVSFTAKPRPTHAFDEVPGARRFVGRAKKDAWGREYRRLRKAVCSAGPGAKKAPASRTAPETPGITDLSTRSSYLVAQQPDTPQHAPVEAAGLPQQVHPSQVHPSHGQPGPQAQVSPQMQVSPQAQAAAQHNRSQADSPQQAHPSHEHVGPQAQASPQGQTHPSATPGVGRNIVIAIKIAAYMECLLRNYGCPEQIAVAAVRNGRTIGQAAAAGKERRHVKHRVAINSAKRNTGTEAVDEVRYRGRRAASRTSWTGRRPLWQTQQPPPPFLRIV